ncbi:MAG: biotin--[acetyl-CoA-carboxylase] ligase [Pirellulales bacterium]|nr:biotin--[acetyl-CoA-carboxylase] ligase [Pirellulales bacterium]
MTPLECARLLEETWIAEVEPHDTLTSTNDRAAELANAADRRLPLLVIADMQTAGRGRGGNRWWTGAGSLAFSVLFVDSPLRVPHEVRSGEGQGVRAVSGSPGPLMGLAAGLAVVDAVRPLLSEREIGLHWPNDVFAAGRKLAGILVEVLPDKKTIIGVGLNANNSIKDAPAEVQVSATSLFDLTQRKQDRMALLISLLNHLDRFLELARTSPTELAAAADAACMQKNRELHLQWGTTVITGLCRGIDDRGAILLETNEGLKAFPSGILLK